MWILVRLLFSVHLLSAIDFEIQDAPEKRKDYLKQVSLDGHQSHRIDDVHSFNNFGQTEFINSGSLTQKPLPDSVYSAVHDHDIGENDFDYYGSELENLSKSLEKRKVSAFQDEAKREEKSNFEMSTRTSLYSESESITFPNTFSKLPTSEDPFYETGDQSLSYFGVYTMETEFKNAVGSNGDDFATESPTRVFGADGQEASAAGRVKRNYSYVNDVPTDDGDLLHLLRSDQNVWAYIGNELVLYVPVFIVDILLWVVIVKLIGHIRQRIFFNSNADASHSENSELRCLLASGMKLYK